MEKKYRIPKIGNNVWILIDVGSAKVGYEMGLIGQSSLFFSLFFHSPFKIISKFYENRISPLALSPNMLQHHHE